MKMKMFNFEFTLLESVNGVLGSLKLHPHTITKLKQINFAETFYGTIATRQQTTNRWHPCKPIFFCSLTDKYFFLVKSYCCIPIVTCIYHISTKMVFKDLTKINDYYTHFLSNLFIYRSFKNRYFTPRNRQ